MRKTIKKITTGILASALAFGASMAGSAGMGQVRAAANTAMAAPIDFQGVSMDSDWWGTGTILDMDLDEVQNFSDKYTYSYSLYVPKAALAENGSSVRIQTWVDFTQEGQYMGSVQSKYIYFILKDNNEAFLGAGDPKEDRDLEESEYKDFISMEENGDFYKITVKDAELDSMLEKDDEQVKIDTSQGGFLSIRTNVLGFNNRLSSVLYIDDLSVKAPDSEVFSTDYSAASLRDHYYDYVLGEDIEENIVERPQLVALDTKLLKLSKSSAIVKVGKTAKIKASAVLDSKITYKSSNKKVATVTAKGVVKGRKAGKAKITVSANGVSKTFKVTVK